MTAIVPTFNRADFLRESLASIIGQSKPPRQIIVVDDGSSDHTAAVAASFGDRIEYLHKRNGGKASALNLALEHAVGAAIWIFDDDDLADPDALRRLATALEASPEVGFAFAHYDNFRIDPDGSRHDYPAAPPRFEADDLFCALLERCFIFQPALLVRRECYDAVGPFDTGLTRAQDYDMLLRLALRYRGTHVPEVAFHQRAHEGPRGSASEPIDGAIVWERQKSFNAKVFAKFYEACSLADYLPRQEQVPHLSQYAQLRALLRRSAAMARGMLWDQAARDISAAAELAEQYGLGALPMVEGAMLSRVFDEFGPRSELHASNPFLLSVAALPASPFRTALLRALTWPLFRYTISSARHADIGQLNSNLTLYRRFADSGTLPAHLSRAIRNQASRLLSAPRPMGAVA